MEWGKYEEFLKVVEKTTGETPPSLLSKPEYPVEHAEYVEAFNLLSRSRTHGFAVGFIPLSEMEVYCRLYDVLDTELFVQVIAELDSVYVEYVNRDRGKGDGRNNNDRHRRRR